MQYLLQIHNLAYMNIAPQVFICMYVWIITTGGDRFPILARKYSRMCKDIATVHSLGNSVLSHVTHGDG